MALAVGGKSAARRGPSVDGSRGADSQVPRRGSPVLLSVTAPRCVTARLASRKVEDACLAAVDTRPSGRAHYCTRTGRARSGSVGCALGSTGPGRPTAYTCRRPSVTQHYPPLPYEYCSRGLGQVPDSQVPDADPAHYSTSHTVARVGGPGQRVALPAMDRGEVTVVLASITSPTEIPRPVHRRVGAGLRGPREARVTGLVCATSALCVRATLCGIDWTEELEVAARWWA